MASPTSVPPLCKTVMIDTKTDKVSLIDHPTPTPKPNSTEHLIKVYASAFCAGEFTWHKWYDPGPQKEYIPGCDLAGVVVTAPAGSPFPAGTEVYTRTNYERGANAREYTIALTEELARKPKRLSFVDAATVPLSAMTAWQALFEHAPLAPLGSGGERERNAGTRVLVTAASGGVGNWVVQLAKLVGCQVVATCGPDNVELVKGLGADEVLNYRTTDLRAWAEEDESRKVDVVIDGAGGKSLEQCWSVVKDNGILMSIREPPEGKKPADWKDRGIKASFWVMQPHGENLDEVNKAIEEGKVKVVLDSAWPLEQFEKAIERSEGGHAKGKVVLKIAE